MSSPDLTGPSLAPIAASTPGGDASVKAAIARAAATGGTDPNALDDPYTTALAGNGLAAGVGGVALATDAPTLSGGPIAQEFAAAQSGAATSGGSMADTLAATFGLSGDSASSAPDFVRTAYGRLQQLGF